MSTAHSASISTPEEKKSGADLSGKTANLLESQPRPPVPDPKQSGSQPLQAVQQAGQFAIMTSLKNNFVTAVGGGGQTMDVLHTDATVPRVWENFTLWFVPSTGDYGIQTANGQFLSATNGGDLSGLYRIGNERVDRVGGASGQVPDVADTIQSTSEQIVDYERFKISNPVFGLFTIQTVRGFYLTAVGGGGHIDPPTFHTDATNAQSWEQFFLLNANSPGSGNTFRVSTNDSIPAQSIAATNGGGESGADGLPPVTLGFGDLNIETLGWTLIRQSDGTYAFQTQSGYYLTAVEGGVVGALRTDAQQVGNFEKFTVIPSDANTYLIQTYNGYYLDVRGDGVEPFPDKSQATAWRLWVLALAPST